MQALRLEQVNHHLLGTSLHRPLNSPTAQLKFRNCANVQGPPVSCALREPSPWAGSHPRRRKDPNGCEAASNVLNTQLLRGPKIYLRQLPSCRYPFHNHSLSNSIKEDLKILKSTMLLPANQKGTSLTFSDALRRIADALADHRLALLLGLTAFCSAFAHGNRFQVGELRLGTVPVPVRQKTCRPTSSWFGRSVQYP